MLTPLFFAHLDGVPLGCMLGHTALIDFGSEYGKDWIFNMIPGTVEYSVMYFTFYFTDIMLTANALLTLYLKTSKFSRSNPTSTAKHSAWRNLRHLALFSCAPLIIQIPYALRQLAKLVRGPSQEGEG